MTPTDGMKMEWISVKKELPYEGEFVLVPLSYRICIVNFFNAGWKSMESGNWSDIDEEIFYWMRLPERPKENL